LWVSPWCSSVSLRLALRQVGKQLGAREAAQHLAFLHAAFADNIPQRTNPRLHGNQKGTAVLVSSSREEVPMTAKTKGPEAAESSNREKDPDDWVTGDETMTGAQASYLKTLCEEAGEEFDAHLTKAEASQRIDQLQAKTGRGRDH
jgi:hypothetical protein